MWRDQLLKFIGKFKYLGMEDLPQKLLVEISSINMEFIESKTGESTAGTYFISVSEIVNGVLQIGAGALLIFSNYI